MLALVLLPLLVAAAQEDLKRWSNDELEVIRTAVPKDGQPLVIAANHRPQYTRALCRVMIPVNEMGEVQIVYVVDGEVVDGDGQLAVGLEAWQDGELGNTCGIRILEKLPVHDDTFGGAFEIRMEFSGDTIFLDTVVTALTAVLHMEDELLTSITGARNGEHIHPTHYDLTLIPNLLSTDPEISYIGIMGTEHRVDEENEGNSISFHMEGLDIIRIPNGILQGTSTYIYFTSVVFDFQRTIVTLESGSYDFKPYDVIVTSLHFEAYKISPNLRNGRGLYKVPCVEGSTKFCWFTQFESSGARMAFPCRDEPDQKATFGVNVFRTDADADGWNTLANMPMVARTPTDGGFLETFATTVVMPTYLIAFAIQDFRSVSSPGPYNVTVWAAEEEIFAGLGDYSAEIGSRVLEYYGQTFGIEYALPKMDMVHVPGKGGAMENWGLVLFSRDTLMFDQEENDVEKRWRVLEVVAHELAHQWTGNLVTMKWWDETWLNEGFASYISHLGADALEPEGGSWARLLVHRTHAVMHEDASAAAWAMSDPVTSRQDVGRKFGGITYSKGASVIRMMEGILTRATMLRGLSTYLAALQFGNSVEEQLFQHFEAAGSMDDMWPQEGVASFEETMKTWTNQAGFPMVTASRLADGSLQLLQTEYTQEGEGGKLWDIPVNWVEVGPGADWEDTRPHTWLTKKEMMVATDSDTSTLLLVNKLGTGYYRVNYDSVTWERIGAQLQEDHQAIHPLQRASIICDVVSLADFGVVSEATRDGVLAYREKEETFGPLLAFKECVDSRGRQDAVKDVVY